jgi:hypothetical protein
MGDTIAWTALGTVVLLATLLFGVIRWITSVARQITLIEATANAADSIAGAALAKAEIMGTEFHNHRVFIAERVADIGAKVDGAAQAVISAEIRLAKSIDNLGERFDKFGDRLDRVLEQR